MKGKRGVGLTDKLYWRFTSDGYAHCFKKLDHRDGGGFISLCGRVEITNSGGQQIARPEPIFRHGYCDNLEAERRGKDDRPATAGRDEWHHAHRAAPTGTRLAMHKGKK